jgi:hypothetical protein
MIGGCSFRRRGLTFDGGSDLVFTDTLMENGRSAAIRDSSRLDGQASWHPGRFLRALLRCAERCRAVIQGRGRRSRRRLPRQHHAGLGRNGARRDAGRPASGGQCQSGRAPTAEPEIGPPPPIEAQSVLGPCWPAWFFAWWHCSVLQVQAIRESAPSSFSTASYRATGARVPNAWRRCCMAIMIASCRSSLVASWLITRSRAVFVPNLSFTPANRMHSQPGAERPLSMRSSRIFAPPLPWRHSSKMCRSK